MAFVLLYEEKIFIILKNKYIKKNEQFFKRDTK